MTAPAAAPGDAVAPARVANLSYFFPAHNEEANLEGLVNEALETLPTIAEAFEIIAVHVVLPRCRPACAATPGVRGQRPKGPCCRPGMATGGVWLPA